MPNTSEFTHQLSALGYLLKGWQLIKHPKLRSFILIPLFINLVVFSIAFWFLFSNINDWIDSYIAKLPAFLTWLTYIMWPLLAVIILFSFSFIFSTFANLIAAPFNGLLAEKTEILLIGDTINNDGIHELIKDLPRIFQRELQKMWYILPRMIGCAILFLIPGFGQTIAPLIWFVFGAWMIVIQYADYPFDNHKITFANMKGALRKRPAKSLIFGMLISVFNAIPIVNFIIMPIAVCGATAFWVDIYKPQLLSQNNHGES